MSIIYCSPQGSAYQVDQTFALGECFVSYLHMILRGVSESHRGTLL